MSRIGLDVTYCFTVRQCQLVDFNLLGFTSVPDPNMNICVMDQGRCDQLALYSWPRRRARRALPIMPPSVACCYLRGAWSAVDAPGKGVPPPPGDARLRRQRCRGMPPPEHSLSARFQATGLPTSPSVAASMKHHIRLHCQLVEHNLLVLPSVPDPIVNVSALDHSRRNQQ